MVDQFKLITALSATSIVFGGLGLIAIRSGTFSLWQKHDQEQALKDLAAKAEINQIKRSDEIAKEAIKNNTTLYDQMIIPWYVANPNTPPSGLNWFTEASKGKGRRITLADKNEYCIGFLEPTGEPTFIYQYQGYKFDANACNPENRTVK